MALLWTKGIIDIHIQFILKCECTIVTSVISPLYAEEMHITHSINR